MFEFQLYSFLLLWKHWSLLIHHDPHRCSSGSWRLLWTHHQQILYKGNIFISRLQRSVVAWWLWLISIVLRKNDPDSGNEPESQSYRPVIWWLRCLCCSFLLFAPPHIYFFLFLSGPNISLLQIFWSFSFIVLFPPWTKYFPRTNSAKLTQDRIYRVLLDSWSHGAEGLSRSRHLLCLEIVFGRLSLSRIKFFRVMSMGKFGPTALNFG